MINIQDISPPKLKFTTSKKGYIFEKICTPLTISTYMLLLYSLTLYHLSIILSIVFSYLF